MTLLSSKENEIRVQSYGGGIQSIAMLYMSFENLIPLFDRVVFADTGAEPQSVYECVQRDKEECRKRNIPFDVVQFDDLSKLDKKGVFVPAHTVKNDTGKRGMLLRQCTQRFKVQPIRRHLRSLGIKKAQIALGISTDEITRKKPSNVKWLENVFPLIDADISRYDCELFLKTRGISAAKSACVFCPYKNNAYWSQLKQQPEEWAKAVDFDNRLRDKREGYKAYVHSSGIPLEKAPVEDFSLQGNLFDNDCSGYCFL